MQTTKFSIYPSGQPTQYADKTLIQYGITGTWWENGQRKSLRILDITTSIDEITFLVEYLNVFQVSLFHVRDVIEDFVGEKACKVEHMNRYVSFFALYMV